MARLRNELACLRIRQAWQVVLVLDGRSAGRNVVVVALVEVEVVQVVSHLTVVEGVVRHLDGCTACAGTGLVEILVGIGVVAVDQLYACAA